MLLPGPGSVQMYQNFFLGNQQKSSYFALAYHDSPVHFLSLASVYDRK